uniref:ethanolamine kinase n=1 Tax=Lygus hesperus TaxID=30085 RepID=A0A0A9X839_LYGHE
MPYPVDTIERIKDAGKLMKRLTIDDEILLLYLLDIKTLLNEVNALCRLYTQVYKIPLLFSHNDCHGRNVIYEPDADTAHGKHQYTLIDFEYTFYNFRGFDLANASLESATRYVDTYPGFEIDYSEQ